MEDQLIFNNAEELSQAILQQQTEQPVQETMEQPPQETAEPIQETVLSEPVADVINKSVESQPETIDNDQEFERIDLTPQNNTVEEQPSFSQQDIDLAVTQYLSEKLGREIQSFDELSTPSIDERVLAIAKFVEETGRQPEDWFRYQSLDTNGMDDLTAVRVQMATEYPNLSYDEINTLLSSKYKVDPDRYNDDDVRLSTLQLKIDGQKAKQSIENIRSSYKAPEVQQANQEQNFESVIDENWIANMSREVDAMNGIEFEISNDKTFTFQLDNNYKNQLKASNANLENYFDSYINNDGSWNYDLLSSHRAVVDNIDTIVKTAYQQGLGDGQKGIVERAANVSTQSPTQQSVQSDTDPVVEQLKSIMGQNNKMTFMNFK